MKQYAIPGMAIGVIADGKPYVFDYGVMSTQSGQPVTGDTLFEIGSVSKTLTATLAADAQEGGELSLADPVGKYLPALQGKPFGVMTLRDLGTHTSGGMLVQVPDSIRDDAGLIRYLGVAARARAGYVPYVFERVGRHLGWLTAKAMQGFRGADGAAALSALGMTHTYINVPDARRPTMRRAIRRTASRSG